MGCGCSGKTGTWIYTNSKGEQSTHDSEISAKAARIRAGGGGSITYKG
jgi:hypothetical protein